MKPFSRPEYRIGYLSIILSAQIVKICLIHANNIPSLPYSNIYFQPSKRFFPPVTYSLFVYGVGLLLALQGSPEVAPTGVSAGHQVVVHGHLHAPLTKIPGGRKQGKYIFKSEHSTKYFITSMRHSVTHLPTLLCQITPFFFLQVNLLCVDLQSMLQEPEGQIKFLHSMQDQTNVALQCNRIQ